MPSPLDAFSILFETEGLNQFETELKNNEKELDKYEKQVKDLEAALDDLNKKNLQNSDTYKSIKKDLEQAERQVKHFSEAVKTLQGRSEFQLKQLRGNFVKLAKNLGSLIAVGLIVRRSLQFYEQAEQLDFLAQKTGVAVEKLQELANAAKNYGGTTESTATSIENIRTNKEEYKKAGIRIEEDPAQTLENVARKMATLKNETEKLDLAKSLGIDEATTRILIQGVDRYREELKRTSKYKLYTKDDIERMREYRQVQQDIRMGLESVNGAIARLLLPAATAVAKVIRNITDWLAEHEGAVKIVVATVAVATGIMGIVAAVGALNAALFFLMENPVALVIIGVIAAITALIAIIQDLIVFLQGGESIIGDILKRIGFNVDEVRQNCLNFFTSLKKWITGAVDWIKSLGGKFSELADKIKAMWASIPEPLKKLIGLSNPITGGYTIVTTAQQALAAANNNRMNSVPAGSISNFNQTQSLNENNNTNTRNIQNTKSNTVNIDKVNIQTQSSDPKEIYDALLPFSHIDNGFRA